jgi:hypothetical protein
MDVEGSSAAVAAPELEAGVSPDRAVRDRFGVARRLDCERNAAAG